MEEIARLMADCALRGKDVLEEVRRFRQNFQEVHYSFDREVYPAPGKSAAPQP